MNASNLQCDLDWNRLRSGDFRALYPEHQDVFDMIERLRTEVRLLNEEISGTREALAEFPSENVIVMAYLAINALAEARKLILDETGT